MKKINLLHTESSKGWGGQERRLMREVLNLPEKYKAVIACQPDSELSKKAKEKGITVLHVKMKGSLDLLAIYKLIKIIDRFNISIVHTHSSIDSWTASFASKLSNKKPKLVRTRHLGGRIKNKLVYTLFPDKIITVGKSTMNYMINEKKIDEKKIIYIPTGINLEKFNINKLTRERLRKELGIDNKTQILGTVSVLRLKKGHRYMFEALKLILNEYPNVKLIVVGDGPQRENLTKLAHELNIFENIIFTGYRKDVSDIVSVFDIFIFPSLEEAFGTALLEAMAIGLPVIASDTGGIGDIVDHGKNGYLVQVKDSKGIYENTLQLLQNPGLARTFGEEGKRKVFKQFSSQIMINRIEKIYNDFFI